MLLWDHFPIQRIVPLHESTSEVGQPNIFFLKPRALFPPCKTPLLCYNYSWYPSQIPCTSVMPRNSNSHSISNLKINSFDSFPRVITFLHFSGSVADLEIFRGGFSFTKTPAKLEVKTKNKFLKKVFTSFLSHLFLAAVSLPSTTAPKLTH